jgi:hypothetical protein
MKVAVEGTQLLEEDWVPPPHEGRRSEMKSFWLGTAPVQEQADQEGQAGRATTNSADHEERDAK